MKQETCKDTLFSIIGIVVVLTLVGCLIANADRRTCRIAGFDTVRYVGGSITAYCIRVMDSNLETQSLEVVKERMKTTADSFQ